MVKDKGLSTIAIILIVIIVGASIGATAYILTRPQPNFQVKSLSVSSEKAARGDTVTARVEVTNTGDAEGTHTVKLEIEGETLEKEVTLDAGESRTVDFDIEKQAKGTYNLNIEDLSETFEVVEPAKFELSNLQVSPKEAEPGETVTVTVDVKNTGGVEGFHELELEVNSSVEKTKEITLESGKETTESFTLKKESSKTYSVEIDDLSQSFEVLAPAEFEVSNLQVSPEEAEPGETVTVTVDVKNAGGVEGSYKLELEVDGSIEESREVTLGSDAETSESFTLSRVKSKSYSIEMDDLSNSFRVLQPAEFEISDLTLSHERVEPGEEVNVSVDLKNVGEVEGTYELELVVNGSVEKTREISLDPEGETTESFTLTKDTSKSYSVEIERLSETFTVLKPAEFEESNLTVNPSEVEPNQDVEISVDVKNIGEVEGTKTLKLNIEGGIEETKDIALEGGESSTVSFKVQRETSGTYSVELEGLESSFKVLQPAKFEVSNLTINPSKVGKGKPVHVSADVRNVGDLSGDYKVKLQVDGNVENSRTVALDGGESTRVSFTVLKETKKSYSVSIGDLTSSFEVVTPATFELSNLMVSPSRIKVGESVEISVDISNTGDLSGKYKVELKVNGNVENSRNISLEGHQNTTVNFTLSKPEEVIYDVQIGNLTDSFEVYSPTKVGGILSEDTTWTEKNSPYEVTETIQVPSDVTLTIEPGVTVKKPSSGRIFLLHGKIIARGESNHGITFDGGGNSKFFDADGSDPDTFLDLKYCLIKNGNSLWDEGYGAFKLKYSKLRNVGSSYVWYPYGHEYRRDKYNISEPVIKIEYNKFINSGGFSIGYDSVKFYFRYNLVKNGKEAVYGGFINNWASYGSSESIIKYNSFLGMEDSIALKLPSGYEDGALSAPKNYWGTTNDEIIENMIYDKNDDINCAGYITYKPILNEPHSETPEE